MSESFRDSPPHQPEVPKGQRVRMIPADVWLGDGENPGIVDLPPEERLMAIQDWEETPRWTAEDERKWQMTNRSR